MNTDAPGSQPLWEDLLLSSDPGVNGFFNSPAVTVGDVGAFSHAVDAYAHNNGSSDPCSSTYISAAQLPDLPPSLPSLENTVCDDDFLMPDIDDFLNNTIAQQDEFLNEMTFRTYMEPGNPTPELWSAEPQAPLLHRKRTRPCSTTSHDTDSPKRKVKVVGKKSAFTQFQTEVLEDWLSRNLADPFPSPEIKASLANSTGLSVRQVERWFARTRQRKLTRLKLEEAGSIGGEEVMAPSQAHPQQGPELRRHGPPEHASSHHEFEMQGRACRSLTGTRTGKMWSFGCLKKRYSLLKDVYTLGSGWRGTSAAAASLNRPSSCPPPSSMAGFLDLFLPRSCGAQSATNGKYSLQVGLPSHPGSPWSIPKSNSRNSNDGRGETAYLEPMWYLQDWGVERWLELLPTDPCGFEALNESERDREPAPDMQGAECRRGGRALNGYGHCDHFLGQLSSGTADPITSLDVRGRSSEHAGSNESSLAGTHANQNRNTEVSAVFTSPQPLQDEATGSKDPGEVASSHAPPELNNAEPHICRICSHSFAKIAQLKRHCQSHFSSKGPFKCLYCSHSFTFSYNLYRHQIRRHPKLRPAAQPSLQRRSSAGKVDSGHQQHSYGASGLQPDQSPGAGNQDFGWNGSAATTQNGAGSPYRYAESLGGSSGAASVASCSSYLTFGPRKGRRVAYGGTSPGVASTSPPTAAWGRDRLPTPPERSNGGVLGQLLMTPDSQSPFDGANHNCSRGQCLFDCFEPSPDFGGSITTDTCKPGEAELREVSKSRVRVKSSGDSSYQCTFCGMGFYSKYGWLRHEQARHAPPKVWVCEPLAFSVEGGNRHSDYGKCPVCWEHLHLGHCSHRFEECWARPEKDRTYFRKDALIQHVRLVHHPRLTQNLYDGRAVDVPTEHLVCPFCDIANATWQDRVEHVAGHFKKGERLSESRWNKTRNQ